METLSGLMRGLQTQLAVIHALVIRETRTRFGGHKLGYFWALLEPMTVILTFYLAYEYLGQPLSAGMDHVTFFGTGLLAYELVMVTSERSAEAINGNRTLLYYPQVHRLDLVFARAVLEGSTLIIAFSVIIAGNALFTGHFEIEDLLGVLLTLIAASLFGTGLGLIFCMAGVVTNMIDRIRGPLLRPMFWVSGVFFTADNLPNDLREWAMWNPILNLVELLRGAWSSGYVATDASFTYVLGWIAATLAAGLSLELYVRRKVEVT